MSNKYLETFLKEYGDKTITFYDFRIAKDPDYPDITAILFDIYVPYKSKSNPEEVKEYISAHPDYVICGATKQLGIQVDSYEANVVENMHRLRDSFTKIDNALSLKPIYMKG